MTQRDTLLESRGAADVPARERHHAPVPRGVLYSMVFAMVMMWSLNFIIGKVAVREFDALTLAAIRIQTAAVLALAVFLARRGAHGFAPLLREWKLMGALGIFGVVFNQGFFVAGLKYTSVAHSSLIVSLGPIFVLILARLHGLEEFTPLKVVGLLLAVIGMIVLVRERHPGQGSSLLGDFFIAGSSLAFAYYVILGKEATPRFESLDMNTAMYTAGAVIMIPLTVAGVWRGGLAQVTWHGWLAMLYMALFSSLLAYLIFYYALHYISATRMSTFSYLQPPIATGLSWMLLGEAITVPLVIGAAIIFAGVYMTERG